MTKSDLDIVARGHDFPSFSSMLQCAESWMAIVVLLDKVAPEWLAFGESVQKNALNAITTMARPQEDAAQIIDEFLHCAEIGRYDGKLTSAARDWLAANQSRPRLEKVEDWQPMSSAPRDRKILLRGRIDTTSRMISFYKSTWNSEYECFINERGWVVLADGWKDIEP